MPDPFDAQQIGFQMVNALLAHLKNIDESQVGIDANLAKIAESLESLTNSVNTVIQYAIRYAQQKQETGPDIGDIIGKVANGLFNKKRG